MKQKSSQSRQSNKLKNLCFPFRSKTPRVFTVKITTTIINKSKNKIFSLFIFFSIFFLSLQSLQSLNTFCVVSAIFWTRLTNYNYKTVWKTEFKLQLQTWFSELVLNKTLWECIKISNQNFQFCKVHWKDMGFFVNNFFIVKRKHKTWQIIRISVQDRRFLDFMEETEIVFIRKLTLNLATHTELADKLHIHKFDFTWFFWRRELRYESPFEWIHAI